MTVAGNITLGIAVARHWRAVVVGAGPAGALLAGLLGPGTLLVDRASFPRTKVCGSCLNPRGLLALQEAGLAELPAQLGAVPLTGVQLGACGREVFLGNAGGVSLSREALDAALVRIAIERGAHFLPQTMAERGEVRPEARGLLLNGQPVWASVVFAADGLGGRLSRSCGMEAPPETGSRIGAGVVLAATSDFYRPGCVYMACGRSGYLGLVRLEDGRLDAACAVDANAVRKAGGVGLVANEILQAQGWPTIAEEGWRGTPPLTRTAPSVGGERLFALGDATGYIEPFTGEGMTWAMSSAVALAPIAKRAVECWSSAHLAEWTRQHRKIVTHRQTLCRAASAVLRRPRLTAALVALLSWMPGLATPVLRHLNAHST